MFEDIEKRCLIRLVEKDLAETRYRMNVEDHPSAISDDYRHICVLNNILAKLLESE